VLGVDDDELRRRIREALAQGRLNPGPGLVLQIRMGTGSRCSACGGMLTGERVQVTYRAADGTDFRLHERCEILWNLERRQQSA
jgi:hypothetical protein